MDGQAAGRVRRARYALRLPDNLPESQSARPAPHRATCRPSYASWPSVVRQLAVGSSRPTTEPKSTERARGICVYSHPLIIVIILISVVRHTKGAFSPQACTPGGERAFPQLALPGCPNGDWPGTAKSGRVRSVHWRAPAIRRQSRSDVGCVESNHHRIQ
jgi:hypothetical protein